MSSRVGAVVTVAALVGLLALLLGGPSSATHFLAALRIARPATVSATVGAIPGAARGQLQSVIASIVAETTTVASDEADLAVPNIESASRVAGFPFRPLGGRTRDEHPRVTVLGAHALRARVNRGQLHTLLVEADYPRASLPADGAPIALATPRAVRVEYGNCPTATANTLQAQLQGPPPPSVENSNCVILTETPRAAVELPPGLDSAAVMTIALELSGMSPNQAHDFRQLFDWPAAVTLAPPRFIRSYELVQLPGAHAMLMITGGRRGPTYLLAWVNRGIVHSLSGYGSAADARPLAESIQ